ncbi:MAG: hypothetical protein AAF514_19675 [Verrucomicrobiota bacterium]
MNSLNLRPFSRRFLQRFLSIIALELVGSGALIAQPSPAADHASSSPLPEKGPRLVTPALQEGAPAAGRRVRHIAPEYADTRVYHSLYLPTDWKPGETYPVLIEYTGNHWEQSGSTGRVDDANLGYGLSGGQGFLWIVLPCVEEGGKQNAATWWGDLKATLDYATLNVPRLCKAFGGDPDRVILCGFSRGAIAANYLGLANDKIAGLWKGFVTHDHYDGVFKVSDEASALERLKRLNGRPKLIMSALGTEKTRTYLSQHIDLKNHRFIDVPVRKLFSIPDGKIIHPHTDLWMHIDSPYRREARRWLRRLCRTDSRPESIPVDSEATCPSRTPAGKSSS